MGNRSKKGPRALQSRSNPGPPPSRPHTASPVQQIVRQTATVEAFSGPMPSPRILGEYNEIVPGAAERILKLFEEQVHHRFALDRSEIRRTWAGLIAGFVIAMSFGAAGVWLISLGRSWEGTAFLTADLVSLVYVFVIG